MRKKLNRCEVCTGTRSLLILKNKNEAKIDENAYHLVCRRHKKQVIKKLEEEYPDAEAETDAGEEDTELREDL